MIADALTRARGDLAIAREERERFEVTFSKEYLTFFLLDLFFSFFLSIRTSEAKYLRDIQSTTYSLS